MKRLDLWHHKFILTLLILAIFICGIFFGIRLSGQMYGTDGLQIMIFALSFLGIVLLFIIFTHVIHLRDEMRKLEEEELTILRRRK